MPSLRRLEELCSGTCQRELLPPPPPSSGAGWGGPLHTIVSQVLVGKQPAIQVGRSRVGPPDFYWCNVMLGAEAGNSLSQRKV